MRRTITLACCLLAGFTLLSGLSSCGRERRKFTALSQLEKATFAVPTGTAGDTLVKSRFPDARIVYHNTVMDCCLAVKAGNPGTMPPVETAGANGVLKFGTAAVVEPFTFVGPDGQITGFDIALARRVAGRLGMTLNIVNMEFGSMIPALISGKVDLIGTCITITPERARSVLFSEPYFDGGIAAVVLK